ncbi:MAG: hypothetical protein ACYC9O_13435 [Candidatus Latescibacterota bacterium]
MKEIVSIRPLHFVDIICDYGAGTDRFEPHSYGHAVHTVANRMLEDRDVLLEITLEPDDVCTPCSHNIDGVCDNLIDRSYRPSAPPLMRDWDLLINQRWCARLNMKEGDRFTARELCQRLRDYAGDITEIFPEILDGRIALKEKNMREGIRKFLER